MHTSQTDPPIEVPIHDSSPIVDAKRRRRYSRTILSSSIFLVKIAAFTIAASCLWLPPVAGFFNKATVRVSVANVVNPCQSVSSRPQSYERQHGRFFHLCLAAAGTTNTEKEEWRALLASFQLYKAAYGDLKVPTRFVVPSMKPWPGESCSLLLVSFVCHLVS